MKKLFTGHILPVLMLAASAIVPAGAYATEYVINGIRYDCTGSGISAKAKIKPAKAADAPYAGDIVIPESVEYNGKTYKVTEAVMSAFAETAVTSVALPEGISSMGNYLFENCTSLTSVTLPTETYSLPMGCFKGCTSLETIEIGPAFGGIQGNVFEGCTSLKNVTINISGYLVGANAFKGCTALEKIVIPDNITMLGVNSFEGCTSLTDVTLSAAMTSIPDYLFKDCSSLATCVLGPAVKSVGPGAFRGCGALKWIECTNTASAVSIATREGKETPFEDDFLANGIFYVPDDMVDAYKASLVGAANVMPVSARLETPVEEWKSVGEATFFDPWICSVFDVPRYSWAVEVEESTTRPGYFRIKNPYLNGKCPMFIAGEANDIYINACDSTMVYIETQGLGFTPNSSAGPEFFISSRAGRHQENNFQSLEKDKEEGLTGIFKEGIITMPAVLWSLPPYTDDDYYNCKYDFELRFANAVVYELEAKVMCVDDYYVNYYKECVDRTEKVPVNITATDPVVTIKYGLLGGVATPAPEILKDIAAGEKVAVRGQNDIEVPDNYVGRVTAVFVALDADGEVRGYTTTLFDVINDELYGPWKDLGETMYEDVIIYSIYNESLEPYSVMMQESETYPGVYRLKDVYSVRGPWNGYLGNIDHHDAYSHYLYINAQDPQAVYVMPSPVGFRANDGSMLLSSQVAMYLDAGYPIEAIKAQLPGAFGTLDEEKITIPDSAVLSSETRYKDGAYQLANPGMEMVVKLPKVSGVETVAAGEDSKPVYYNLQGVRIASPARGVPSIEVRGGKALKIIRR